MSRRSNWLKFNGEEGMRSPRMVWPINRSRVG